MFLLVTCQHASGTCQSHFCPILSLRKVPRKYVKLSPNTLPFLTLQFREKDLTLTPNLFRIRPIPPPLGHILSRLRWIISFLTSFLLCKILILLRAAFDVEPMSKMHCLSNLLFKSVLLSHHP